MKYFVKSVAFTVAVSLQALRAAPGLAAGPYTDELSKCLVRSTTTSDKTLLVKWIFSTMALHPDVKGLATVSDAQRIELNETTARLFERLLTNACLSETREALKYEGQSAIEASFGVLGQVASRELFANQSVASGLAEFAKYFDEERLRKDLELSK
jgi:hypothetical protein